MFRNLWIVYLDVGVDGIFLRMLLFVWTMVHFLHLRDSITHHLLQTKYADKRNFHAPYDFWFDKAHAYRKGLVWRPMYTHLCILTCASLRFVWSSFASTPRDVDTLKSVFLKSVFGYFRNETFLLDKFIWWYGTESCLLFFIAWVFHCYENQKKWTYWIVDWYLTPLFCRCSCNNCRLSQKHNLLLNAFGYFSECFKSFRSCIRSIWYVRTIWQKYEFFLHTNRKLHCDKCDLTWCLWHAIFRMLVICILFYIRFRFAPETITSHLGGSGGFNCTTCNYTETHAGFDTPSNAGFDTP